MNTENLNINELTTISEALDALIKVKEMGFGLGSVIGKIMVSESGADREEVEKAYNKFKSSIKRQQQEAEIENEEIRILQGKILMLKKQAQQDIINESLKKNG